MRRAGGLLMVVVLLMLCASYVEAEDPKMPAPWGLGLTVYDHRQPYSIDQLDFQIPSFALLSVEDLEVDSRTTTYHLKFDYWVLPFLNVYLIGGQIDGSTVVNLQDTELGLPVPLQNIRVEYDGWVYGGGFTLAGGWDSYFATVTVDYNETDLSTSDSSVKATVITPRIGYQSGGTAIYVGGMHQRAEERHEGRVDIPLLGTVPYSVELSEKTAWNYLAGITTGIGEHWMLTLEGFFGDRDAVLIMLDYRWGG